MEHNSEHQRPTPVASAPRRAVDSSTVSVPNQTLGVPAQQATSPPAAAAETARQGLGDASAGLPHFEILQQAFAGFDLSGVRSSVGGEAKQASQRLCAEAYATPEGVGFRDYPTLHTAAHEAAHVVQQRMGHAPSRIGRDDPLEQHADRVADAVVAGDATAPLFNELGQGGASVGQAVQLKSAKEQAEDLEARDGGHSLDRHGPDVSDQALKDRLTTGVAPDGAFVPAPGMSTKFASHDDYLTTRQAAVGKMDAGLAAARSALQPKCTAVVDAKSAFETEPSGANKGKLSQELKAKRKALVDGAAALGGAWVLKVKAEPMAASAEDMVVTYGSYKCVVDHGKKIGSGFSGSDEKTVTSPDGAKTGTGYDTVTPVPSVTKTRTTFDVGGKKSLATAGSAAAFKAAQHFPCDEPVGITV